MTNSDALMLMQSSMVVAIKLAAPMLLISMAVGVLISILQAATQIHEQTITFVPKLIIISLILLGTGGTMLETMQDLCYQLFEMMLRF